MIIILIELLVAAALYGQAEEKQPAPLSVCELIARRIEYNGRLVTVRDETKPGGHGAFLIASSRVHYVYYTPEIEAARHRGDLRTNSFIRLRKSNAESRPALEIDDMGDSEALLRNNVKLCQLGQRLIRRGIIPQDDGWSGWLGRYQKALCDAVTILETPSVTKQSERSKNRDLGR